MSAERIVELVRQLELPNVFNPYKDCCELYDLDGAPGIRTRNLAAYLAFFQECGSCSLWLGRDCGYRGARRTGIALTDESSLHALTSTLGIDGIQIATRAPLKERTAREVWLLLPQIDEPVFLWNVFPLHPHFPEEPMSNRPHTRAEFDAACDVLLTLTAWLKPTRVVALGADAYNAATKVGIETSRVRHPSYGGQAAFASGIRSLYAPGFSDNLVRVTEVPHLAG